MAIKKLKPKTPGMRGTAITDYKKVLSGHKPYKPLIKYVHRKVGRSNGRVSVRGKGGGHKRLYRLIDFKYDKRDMYAKIQSIEYDPNRTSFISLICFEDGERRYVLTPKGVKVGDKIIVAEKAPIKPGNRIKLSNIPAGTYIYNVELKENGGAKLARSAGNFIELLGHDKKYAHIKMPSKEIRKVSINGFASIGHISNSSHHLKVLGKAGRSIWLGKKQKVRGAAMNPVDHPHGGGEGKAGRGRKRAVTKWGKPCGKGQKTRKKAKYSRSLITKRRKVGKQK